MFSCQPASRDESSEGLIFATESVPGVSFNFFNGQMLHFAHRMCNNTYGFCRFFLRSRKSALPLEAKLILSCRIIP